MQREIFLQTKDLQKIKDFLGMGSSPVKLGGRTGSEDEEEEDVNVIAKNANIVEYVKKKVQKVIDAH